jgi:hypothetical protein
VTHEALIRATENADLQRLRELVQNIAAQDEPAQLDVLFEQLRSLVGLTQVDASSQTGSLPHPSFEQPAEK